MKTWQLTLTADEIWWVADALKVAKVFQERHAAATSDEHQRRAYLISAEKYQRVYDDRLAALEAETEPTRRAAHRRAERRRLATAKAPAKRGG